MAFLETVDLALASGSQIDQFPKNGTKIFHQHDREYCVASSAQRYAFGMLADFRNHAAALTTTLVYHYTNRGVVSLNLHGILRASLSVAVK